MGYNEASGTGGRGDLAIVLTGGGARAAYQAGVLRGLARHLPETRFPVVVGVSAGAINAAFIGSHPGTLFEAADELCHLWAGLHVENIFHLDTPLLTRSLLTWIRWATRLGSGGPLIGPEIRGLVETEPLRDTLRGAWADVDGEIIGIERNLERGRLKAMALITLNYSTGQTVTWVQGRHIQPWDEPRRRSVQSRLTLEHVMASSALPFVFPAIRLGHSYYGDGGVRLSAPLSPAIRFGATRVLAISARHEATLEEADRPQIVGYPPPAQILSHLFDAIFLDVLDEDVRRLKSLNPLIEKLPPEDRNGLRPVDIRVLRPSEDLGKLSAAYEPQLPEAFRLLTRSLGTRQTTTPDVLSYLMFQPDYLEHLIRMGEADAEARLPALRDLLEEDHPEEGLQGHQGPQGQGIPVPGP
ncbi:MAG TPA: patatin-like phospholipase family protein [Thermoanaerobaculia bacterium]|nr:patatin-like phospholipase family protein [Thermoanaerobaculia bacterium]